MKIVVDLQSCQTSSSKHGIGRYSYSLVKSLLINNSEHEYILLLSSLLPNIDHIYEVFEGLISSENIKIWNGIESSPTLENFADINELNELLREFFIESLKPDVILITSLFEFGVATTSIKRFDRKPYVVAILYDIIPYIYKEQYLVPEVEETYMSKIKSLQAADHLFSISQSAKDDALKHLEICETKITAISTAVSEEFVVKEISIGEKEFLLNKYNITKSTIVYAPSGFDSRKNLTRLLEAYSILPDNIKSKYQLVIIGKCPVHTHNALEEVIDKYNIVKSDVIFTGYVSDDDLVALYNICDLVVYPSLHEGFGLPALEAMNCGAIVIGSNTTSVPEVIGYEEATFDPYSVESISSKINEVLTDQILRSKIKSHQLKQIKKFSWDFIAKKLIDVLEQENMKYDRVYNNLDIIDVCVNLLSDKQLDEHILVNLSNALDLNGHSLDYLPRVIYPSAGDEPTLENPVCQLCTISQLDSPIYYRWMNEIKYNPRLHRKEWEWVYIIQTLYKHGMLADGRRGLGFGCGQEPLPLLFTKYGVNVTITDMGESSAVEIGWTKTNEHLSSIEALFDSMPNIVADKKRFLSMCNFEVVDMNHIPESLSGYDFVWSACAFEHLGSIRNGLDFIKNTMRCLKPGGISVHTTEFNLSSNDDTVEEQNLVVFRLRDFQQLKEELEADGHEMSLINTNPGNSLLDDYVDLPPYSHDVHTKLLLNKYVSTSIGIIVKKNLYD
ncbi:glycosyltransferase [Francisella philomiragia]|uniref:glycosyltransferase n=1 Tax=Francisella philomiragia TaxID=28110 RepID=UPI001903DD73|nr:glycosyltransferase [Francisella philomiragia]MBK2297090.1 glycosyltransferase [Francisella philomiragia]MBK2341336.1 glycosyltransferase [Francisella philomiragia]